MNRTGLFQGLEGAVMVRPNKDLEVTYKGRGKPDGTTNILGQGYKVAPKMFNQSIDYSSRRGVKPCYSITRMVGRTPPLLPASAGLMPVGGQGRAQLPSMVNPRPQNLPILVPRSNLNAASRSPLGIPT